MLEMRRDYGQVMEGDLTADRRLYLDAQGAVVEADSPSRASLLAPAGGRIRKAEAQRLGLRMEGGRVVWGEKAESAEAAPSEEPAPAPTEVSAAPAARTTSRRPSR